ncbi:MAG: A24 family peptidase [Eubacteriales bacterium]|nr:A24 family peptidase [Eubacteriales bacterium]
MMFLLAGGLITGIVCLEASKRMIKKRSDEQMKSLFLIGAPSYIIWALCFGLVFAFVGTLHESMINQIYYLLVFSLCACISAVDLATRKIPNIILLLLMGIGIVMCFLGDGSLPIVKRLVGMFAASVVFMIPSYMKINVGNGDIKLATVIGFMLGVSGFLQAMIIMALGMLIYTAFLYISKTGTIRSMAPMGPYISLGFIISLLYPMI